MNKEQIEAQGFKVDTAGKVRTAEGKMVKAAVAEQVANGAILANFNMDELKKRKARKAATGTANLVEALNKISPAIGLLEVGHTARLPIPTEGPEGKDPKRAFVMGIVTKLNNITQKGREWAGRKFDSLSDDGGEFFYITRLEDGEAHVRKPGGGRKPGSTAETGNSLEEAMKRAKAHLEGDEEQPETEKLEEATVITH